MLGKKFLIFSLYAYLFIFTAQSKDQRDLQFDTSSPAVIVAQTMTYFYRLDELGKLYLQKYSEFLPVWCSKCKKHKLHIGSFSGSLLALLLKNAFDKKEVDRLAPVFDKFLQILTATDPQESTMVDFVLQEIKNLDCKCSLCQVNAWEKIPESPVDISSNNPPITTKSNMTEAEEIAFAFGEMIYYFEAHVQLYTALQNFKKKHHEQVPEIACKLCPKRTLPCDELLIKIQAKALKKTAKAKGPVADQIRKEMLTIYQEISQLIDTGTEDNIRKYMVKIAQDKKIPCKWCQKVHWEPIKP